MKLNAAIRYNELRALQTKRAYRLIFRTVFTIKPLQMIALFYRTDTKRFYACVWNTKNGRSWTREIRLRELRAQLPYVKAMLRIRCY
jgi:hypothetical protein